MMTFILCLLAFSPINTVVKRGERYYASITINRSVEGIVKGVRRQLLTMATGTGKTAVAFQISWKLWNARWNPPPPQDPFPRRPQHPRR